MIYIALLVLCVVVPPVGVPLVVVLAAWWAVLAVHAAITQR